MTGSINLALARVGGLFFRIRRAWIVILVIGLGIAFAHLLSLSRDSATVTLALVFFLALMLLVMKQPLTGLLALMVLTPFVETSVKIPLGAGIPDLSLTRFVVGFMGVAMLARAAVGEFKFRRPDLVDGCVVLATIGIMLAAPKADSPVGLMQEAISRFFVPLSMYFFARNLVRSREDLLKLFWAIAIFGLLVGLYAIYEYTTGNILFLGESKVASQLNTSYSASLRLLRGLTGSPNIGRMLGAAIPVTFYLFFTTRSPRWKLLLIGALVVQFYGTFLTFNRGAWYSLLISLSIIQFFYPQFRRLYLVIVLVAGLTLWATWDQVNESTVVEERVNKDSDSFNGREPRWQAGLNMWKEKPIWGWGPDAFRREAYRFRDDGIRKNFNNGAIENDYLDVMVTSGLVGFLPYLIFLIIPLIGSVFLFFKARAPGWRGFIDSDIVTIYWSVIFAFILGSYTQTQIQLMVKIIPFALTGAIVGSHLHLLRAKKQPRSAAAAGVGK